MSHPATDKFELAEAKTYLDALKKSFTSTWHGTERTVEFLMQVLERQTQQIQNLEGKTNNLEREIQEKSTMINSFEARIAELESHVNMKDRELVEVKNDNDRLKTALTHVVTRYREYHEKMGGAEANLQSASAEVASLRVKLAEAEERAAAGVATAERKEGSSLPSGLSDEQVKKMEAALKQELETRNEIVRKAAREAIGPLRNAYVASLARVKELEEQLQRPQSTESVATHTSAVSSGVNEEGPSSSTPSHIVSGKYRPKPSPTPFRQTSDAATASHPASVATPPPLSQPTTQINPYSSSTISAQEIIDLTELNDFRDAIENDHTIIEGAAQHLKRRRVDSDNGTLLPLGTVTVQSNAHRPTHGGTDGSQPQDIHH